MHIKILGIIPARGGSKGVPRKNIKLLNGKSLISYTVESAKASRLLTKTILSSEDHEIIEEAKRLELEVPFVRPNNLAADNSPTLPVIKHALNYLAANGEIFDAVCLLQATNPFRPDGFIDKAIKEFISKGTDSLLSVLEVPHEYNPHWTFKAQSDGVLKITTGDQKIISRRQELPKAFYRDGALYITKSSVILSKNSLYGDSISYIKSDPRRNVNIDTIEDWKQAEFLVKNMK